MPHLLKGDPTMARPALVRLVLASIALDVATSFAIAPLNHLLVSEVLLLTQPQHKELSAAMKTVYHLLGIVHAEHSILP